MRLMLVYTVLLIIGETGAVYLGLYLDRFIPALSVPIALTLFFSVLIAAWYVAVAITDRFFPEAKVE